MDAQAVAVALLIGAIALPGSFLAKLMVERMPLHVHSAILDAVVIAGGGVMISTAARSLLSLEAPRGSDAAGIRTGGIGGSHATLLFSWSSSFSSSSSSSS